MYVYSCIRLVIIVCVCVCVFYSSETVIELFLIFCHCLLYKHLSLGLRLYMKHMMYVCVVKHADSLPDIMRSKCVVKLFVMCTYTRMLSV